MLSEKRLKISLSRGDPEQKFFPWISALVYVITLLAAPLISEYLFLVTFAVQIYRMLRYDIRIA